MSKKIANTKRSGLSVVRVDRNKLDTLYYQLIDIVQDGNLGDDYVNFFAKPKDVTSEKSIDWYTELTGTAVSFKDLSPEEAKATSEKFKAMVGKLTEYSEALRAKGDRSSADLIKSALNIPNENYLVKVGDNVVMTCWGFLNSGEITAKDGELTGSYSDRHEKENEGVVEDSIREGYVRSKSEEDIPLDDDEIEVEEDDATSPTGKRVRKKRTKKVTTKTQEGQVINGEEVITTIQETVTTTSSTTAISKRKSALGIILFVILLLLLLGFLLWYFLLRDNNAYNNPPAVPAVQQPISQDSDQDSKDSKDSKDKDDNEEPDLSFLKGEMTIKQGLENENHELLDVTISIDNNVGKGVVEIESKIQKCKGEVLASLLKGERVNYALSNISCPNGNNFDDFDFVCDKSRSSCYGTAKDGAKLEVKPTVDN
jgi:hypothetical protein